MNSAWPWKQKLQRLLHSPLFWILVTAALLRLPGLFWGLPASDGWDDDGVAPRNFLVGLAQTYAPGAYFTYPPLHMILLALLTLPGWLIALLNAPSLHPHDVIAVIIHVPYMTFFAVVARLVSVVMSLATIYLVACMGELMGGRRAGLFAAAVCAVNAAFTYYGQVSNLDGPYMFWSVLSLLAWMRLFSTHDLKQLRIATLTAAAAIATKDQAYAVFILSMPAALLLWLMWRPRVDIKVVVPQLVLWSGLSLFLLLLIDGAITNPHGFAARLSFLSGPASQDYTLYSHDWAGRLRLLGDMGHDFSRYYPLPVAALAGLGVALWFAQLRRGSAVAVAGLVPLLAIVSYTVAFNLVALRTEVRFLLPQTILLAVYAGIAADRICTWSQPQVKVGVRVLLVALLGWGLYACGGIVAALLNDPRYDAERWLAAHVEPGTRVETYGLNAYLPRFPAGAIVTRLDVKPADRRNPLPGVHDIDQPFGAVASRHPRFIVVSEFWVRDYLKDERSVPRSGRVVQAVKLSQAAQAEPRTYFRALYGGKLRYRIAHQSQYVPHLWPAVEGYESLAQRVDIFELTGPQGLTGSRPWQSGPARIRN